MARIIFGQRERDADFVKKCLEAPEITADIWLMARDKPWNPMDTSDLLAVDSWLRAAQLPWFERLTAKQKLAISAYKGALGRVMNASLQRGDPGALTASINRLSAALAQAEAPADMILCRGISRAEANIYHALTRHGRLHVRLFVSTTLSKTVAAAFAQRARGVVIELIIHKGQSGVAYIHPFPTYRYPQWEVLINAGSRLDVLRADAEVIRLEVIDGDDFE